jgi:hypothetical protein
MLLWQYLAMGFPSNIFVFRAGVDQRLCLVVPMPNPFIIDDLSAGSICTYRSAEVLEARIAEASLHPSTAERLKEAIQTAYQKPNTVTPIIGVELTTDQLERLGFNPLTNS